MNHMSNGPLTNYRILDLTGPIGYHCLKLLADMGADVLKVEPPAGDPARMTAPFKGDLPHREGSLYFLHYNSNKRGVTLDVRTPDGREVLKELAKRTDVVVESFRPGESDDLGAGYEALRAIKPDIVVCSITPFGLDGPWRDYKGVDLTGLALSNTMVISGEPGQAPVQAPGDLAYGMTGTYAAYAIAVALYHRRLTGEGQFIEVSMHECSAHIAGYAASRFSGGDAKPYRTTRAGETVDQFDVYRTQDGYVRLFILNAAQWRRLIEWIGDPADPISDPIFDEVEWRRENLDLINPIIAAFVAEHTKLEMYLEGQRRRIGVSPVNTAGEFVDSAQSRARNLFVDMEHPIVGPYKQYAPVPKLSRTPGSIRVPAPLLGQHNLDVYCGELGMSNEDLMALAARGVI